MVHFYGFGYQQWLKMAEAQNWHCLICGSTDELHIDHDHETGRIRGLLCGLCNRGIGALRHSPEVLQKAIEYLTKD